MSMTENCPSCKVHRGHKAGCQIDDHSLNGGSLQGLAGVVRVLIVETA